MKKIMAFIGSLLVVSGLKAQNNPVIRKETTPPPAVNPVGDSVTKSLKQGVDIKTDPGAIKLHKDIKQQKDMKELKNMKEMKEIKDMKEMKDHKDIKLTTPPATIKESGIPIKTFKK